MESMHAFFFKQDTENQKVANVIKTHAILCSLLTVLQSCVLGLQ